MESVGIWPERCDKCNLLLGAGEGSEVRSRKGKDEVRGRGMTPAIGQEWFHPNPYGSWVPVLLHNRGFGGATVSSGASGCLEQESELVFCTGV